MILVVFALVRIKEEAFEAAKVSERRQAIEARRYSKATTRSCCRHERARRGKCAKEVELKLVLLETELIGVVKICRRAK